MKMKWLFPVGLVILVFALAPMEASWNYPPHFLKFGQDRAIDQTGSIYLVSASYDINMPGKYVVSKYDRQGKKQWECRDFTFYDIHSVCAAIAVDERGNAYVTCKTPIHLRAGEYQVYRFGCMSAKYDKSGSLQWVAPWTVAAKDTANPESIAADSKGNVYLTGTCGRPESVFDLEGVRGQSADFCCKSQALEFESSNESSDLDIITIKYDTNGRQLWSARYRSPGNVDDRPVDIAVQDTNHIYVIGRTSSKGAGKFLILKYDTTGRLLWAVQYTGKNSHSWANASAVDSKGNIYVAGSVACPNDRHEELVTVKYDSKGMQQWVEFYRDPEKDTVVPCAVRVDQAGNVVVTGRVSVSPWENFSVGRPSATKRGYSVIAKYTDDGKEQWIAKDEGLEDNEVFIYDLLIDTGGNVYAIGFVDSDAVITKYDSKGTRKYVIQLKTVSELAKFLSTLSLVQHHP